MTIDPRLDTLLRMVGTPDGADDATRWNALTDAVMNVEALLVPALRRIAQAGDESSMADIARQTLEMHEQTAHGAALLRRLPRPAQDTPARTRAKLHPLVSYLTAREGSLLELVHKDQPRPTPFESAWLVGSSGKRPGPTYSLLSQTCPDTDEMPDSCFASGALIAITPTDGTDEIRIPVGEIRAVDVRSNAITITCNDGMSVTLRPQGRWGQLDTIMEAFSDVDLDRLKRMVAIDPSAGAILTDVGQATPSIIEAEIRFLSESSPGACHVLVPLRLQPHSGTTTVKPVLIGEIEQGTCYWIGADLMLADDEGSDVLIEKAFATIATLDPKQVNDLLDEFAEISLVEALDDAWVRNETSLQLVVDPTDIVLMGTPAEVRFAVPGALRPSSGSSGRDVPVSVWGTVRQGVPCVNVISSI